MPIVSQRIQRVAMRFMALTFSRPRYASRGLRDFSAQRLPHDLQTISSLGELSAEFGRARFDDVDHVAALFEIEHARLHVLVAARRQKIDRRDFSVVNV